MSIFILNRDTNLFLNSVSEWGPRHEAYDFRNVAFAVDWCLMRRLLSVRIVLDSGDPANAVFLDVHGVDREAFEVGIKKNERLRQRQRALVAQLETIKAELEERRKRYPLKRAQVSKHDSEPGPVP